MQIDGFVVTVWQPAGYGERRWPRCRNALVPGIRRTSRYWVAGRTTLNPERCGVWRRRPRNWSVTPSVPTLLP